MRIKLGNNLNHSKVSPIQKLNVFSVLGDTTIPETYKALRGKKHFKPINSQILAG